MDIFDMVKAAPPPQTINPVDTKLSTPSPIPPDSPIDVNDLLESGNVDENDLHTTRKSKKVEHCIDLLDSESSFDELDELLNKNRRRSVATSKPKKTRKSTVSASTPHNKSTTVSMDDIGEAFEEDQPSMVVGPTKTKAQQKMFSDQQAPNVKRKVRVRIRRLKQPEIDSAVESLANSSFVNVPEIVNQSVTSGRSRPKKKKTSPKKQKSSTAQTNFHIKVPLQNGAKKRALNHSLRAHTPPPSLAKRAGSTQSALKPSPKPKIRAKRFSGRGRNTDPDLVKRYGARFFGCVVKVRRTRLPTANCPPIGVGGLRKGYPKKAVSFSEAVEILGSPGGPSRRATFGSLSSRGAPKPTRLQRVDATGNVLEDIALTSTPLFSPSSGGSRERGRRRSCNGTPVVGRLKRSNQSLQLRRLDRLSIDNNTSRSGADGDGDNDGDDDEEYIVPNDVPGSQRSGTPPPKKKKISFTTTISDDEDEKPVVKKQKDAQKKQTKPLRASSNKKKDKMLKEKGTTDKTQTKKEKKTENSNEIVKGVLPQPDVEIESSDADDQIKPPAKEIQTEELEGDVHETETNEVERDRAEQIEDATEQNTDEAKETVVVEEEEEKSEDDQEEASLDEDEENLEEEAAETIEKPGESPGKPTNEDRVEKVEDVVEQAEEFSDLPTPPQLPSTTDDNEDDVLEIQTSLDDVRQLHTPSSRQSTPKSRSRLDSGDSDCSFKSASENAKLPAGQAIEETEKDASKASDDDEDQKTAATIIDVPIDSDELPAELMTPPSAPRTVNGDPTSESRASAPYYSSIDDSMATLDDVIRDQLSEPDFQLNSSRHAISRGTLDEIMTALES
ncbi:microtubule-associated protein 1B isoform X1 [Drosophila simulans]|uniref:microtubule-associated protein 1B isoform X1 n=1 Tax=Drosophila simulans TaxID=7240 RepID=UPI00078AE36B|nr:microtubule-associated protein 1B isoform X1 [Drosophila simulans]KMZ09279.1 uncharacterized protein Dsimw501_GD17023, isoform C [Drosophila simulans]